MTTTKDRVHYIVKKYGFLVYNIGFLIWAAVAFLLGTGQEANVSAVGEMELEYGTGIGLAAIGIMWVVGNILLAVTYFATKPDDRVAHV